MAKAPKLTVEQASSAAHAWLDGTGAARKATINDVAAMAEVSKKTVSRVINASPMVHPVTRQVVNAIIEIVGYKPDPQARGLARRHSFLIGMVYDNPNPQYVVNMQEGILDGLRGTDYELVVHPCERGNPNNAEDILAFAARLNLHAAVLTPSISEDDSIADALEQAGVRYIRVASVALSSPDKMIVTQDREGGRAAAQHLIELGHTKIGHLTGLKGFRSAHERQRGFEMGLNDAGLTLRPEFVFSGDYTFAAGVQCAETLLSKADGPTAVFAANDEMAAGMLHAMVRARRGVPETLSIIGYDDFKVAQDVFPQLTTLHSPIRNIGRYAAHLAIGQNENDEQSTSKPDILPRLVARGSSGPPPRSAM